MSHSTSYKYRAFISYSHVDRACASRLQRQLETWPIEKDLVGMVTPAGAIPASLRPIFRDRVDLAAGSTLACQIVAALTSSQFLIVICSPHAARSQQVNEEVRLFKTISGSDRILPIIIDGIPGDPKHECFPTALTAKLRPDGTLTNDREEPCSADARPQGDGAFIARLKVTAGLLGLSLDDVHKREAAYRRRALQRRTALAGLTTCLAIGAGMSTWFALVQSLKIERDLNVIFEAAKSVTARSADLRNQFAVPVP